MLETLQEAIEYLYDSGRKDIINVIDEFLDAIDEVCKEESSEFLKISSKFRSEIYNYNEIDSKDKIDYYYKEMKRCVTNIPRQYKVVFFPYYENTWDSLKSVYDAFKNDPNFITEIVIIPIYRNIPTGRTLVYEDYLTPQGIENTHYTEYNAEIDQPDIVFYNNPYDGVNLYKFASYNIKKYVGCMVYVPYFLDSIPEYFTKESFKNFCISRLALDGQNNADIIICGSDWVKKIIKGKNSSKLIALGNPKTDYFIESQRKKESLSFQWDNILVGYTFMLNTHYSEAVNYSGLYIHILKLILHYIKENEDTSLIWRPHPQTFLMLEGRDDKYAKKIISIMRKAESLERVVLDTSGSAVNAYLHSDAFISTSWSSTIKEAIFFDLPVFICKQSAKSRTDIRLINKSDKIKGDMLYWQDVVNQPDFKVKKYEDWDDVIIEFMNDVKCGKDYNKERRKIFIEQAFKNGDGKCGNEICEYIKIVLNEENIT